MKKILKSFLFAAMCICACVLLQEKEARAAESYQVIWPSTEYTKKADRMVGKTVYESDKDGNLYAVRDGERVLLVSDKNLDSRILASEDSLYYCVIDDAQRIARVYWISEIGEEAQKVFSHKLAMEECFNLEGYYDEVIYYINGSDFSKKGYNLYSYSIGSKKKKLIIKDAGSNTQRGQFFYSLPYLGDNYYTGAFRLYNARSGKLKIVCKKCPGFEIIGNKLYYMQVNKQIKGKRYGYDVAIKKCNLNGTGKKAVVKSVKIKYYQRIKKNSFIYYNLKGKKWTKKF